MPPPSRPRSPLLIGFGLAALLLVVLIQLDLVEYAYGRIGIGSGYVLAVLLASLVGSGINLPVGRLPASNGARGTLLAVNLGGAVIPTLLSVYLLAMNRPVAGRALLAVAVVAIAVHLMARPVPQFGIAVPIFVPPLVAAAAALLLASANAPPVAYVAGTLGTLIGADLTNLRQLGSLGAPIASIGGAGTFDGIFVTGILAVLLA